jgi:large subunit ribosomal protein L13
MKKTRVFHEQEHKWVLIDARDKILGRLTTHIAKILQGKHKPTYTPNAFSGDRVVVINARHIRLSADKFARKTYQKYSGYPSGRRIMKLKDMMEKNPSRALYLAVKGMLPNNNLGYRMLKSLKIYPEGQHRQQAQKPQAL